MTDPVLARLQLLRWSQSSLRVPEHDAFAQMMQARTIAAIDRDIETRERELVALD